MVNTSENFKQDKAHPIDIHVGKGVRNLRLMRGITQSEIAEKLGLSFQQVQKYETGANRISASKLYMLSGILNIEPCYFFKGLDDEKKSEIIDLDPESARLAALISQIKDKETKNNLRNLIKSMGTN